MATTNKKGTAAAPAKDKDTDEPAKRTRLSFGKEKRLAMMILSLVAVLQSKEVAAVLTPEQKQQAVTAKTAADEIGANVLEPVTTRIAAVAKELRELDYTKPEAPGRAKELGIELNRLAQRKTTIENMIAGKGGK